MPFPSSSPAKWSMHSTSTPGEFGRSGMASLACPKSNSAPLGRLSRPTCRRALLVRAGRRHDRTGEGPAQPGARRRRIGGERPCCCPRLGRSTGMGEAALDDAIEAAAARAWVVRTGWVEERTLAALLRGAAVLAYPSIYEGFGFPPLQAMAAGIPVVATRAGALPEILGMRQFLSVLGMTPHLHTNWVEC